MHSLVLSNNQPIASGLRQALQANVIECRLENLVSVDRVDDTIRIAEPAPDLIFVVLSPDADAAIAVLEHLRARSRSRVCAVGPIHDPRAILRVVRAGATDYLDEDGSFEEQIGTLLNRLQEPAAAERGFVVSVVSPCGGSGCTTLAANLATALASERQHCALLDFDLRTGDIVSMFRLKPTHSIIDLCANLPALDDELFEQALLKHESGVHVLAAPQCYSKVRQVSPACAAKIVRIASRLYPIIVVDLEDFVHREQYQTVLQSDRILIPFRLEFAALRNIDRTFEHLMQDGIDPERVDLVLNQHGRPGELSLNDAEKALGRKVKFVLPHDPRVTAAADRGIPAVVDARRSRYACAIQQIADSIFAPVVVS